MKLMNEVLSLIEARMKILKIDGREVDGVLLAGGYGAKVYSVDDKFVIQKGKNNIVFDEKNKDYAKIMKFANYHYQPKEEQEKIQNEFKELVASL